MFFSEIDAASETAQAPKPLKVARDAARTVPWVMGVLSAGMRERGAGLHPAQVRVLMALQGRAIGPSELAERLQVSLPTISKTLAVLERHGWIERAPDEADRRRVVVRLTQEGHERMAQAVRDGVTQLADALAAADESELDNIERGFASLRVVLARAGSAHRGHGCGGPGRAAARVHPSAEDAPDRRAHGPVQVTDDDEGER